MPYLLPDGTQIWFELEAGHRTGAGDARWDSGFEWDRGEQWDGASNVDFKTIPNERVLSLRSKAGKDRFGKRFRASSLKITVDNHDGLFTSNLLQPGDYVALSAAIVAPGQSEPDIPIPDGHTWLDETGREWTAHGNLVLADEPFTVNRRTLFYGRVDTAIDVVRNGKDVTNILCYDVFAELAPINKDAVPPVGAGEATRFRLNRIIENASAVVSPTVGFAGLSQATMQATTLAQGALDMLHLTIESEGGDMWAATSRDSNDRARLSATNRDYLTTAGSAINVQYVFGSVLGFPILDAQVTREQQLIVNDATFSNVGGVAQNTTDAASEARYGPRTTRRLDLIAEADTQAQFLAQRTVANLKETRPRIRDVTVQVVDFDSALMAGDISFLDLTLATVESIYGWSYTAAAHVIGISHTIVGVEWNISLHLDDAFVDNVDGAYSSAFSNAFTLG